MSDRSVSIHSQSASLQNNSTPVNTEDRPKKKLPPFAPLFKAVYPAFKNQSAYLGSYSIILYEISWGEHKKKLRNWHIVHKGQFLTTYKEIAQLCGLNHRTLKNHLRVFALMKLIRVESVGSEGIRISRLNAKNGAFMTVKEAINILESNGELLSSKAYTKKKKGDDCISDIPDLESTIAFPTPQDCISDVAEDLGIAFPTSQDCISDTAADFPPLSLEEEEYMNFKIEEREAEFREFSLSGEYDPNTLSDFKAPKPKVPPQPKVPNTPRTVLKGPPLEHKVEADAWLVRIKQSYPNTSVGVLELIRILGEAKKILEPHKIKDGDLFLVISWVSEYGSAYLQNKFFKTPKDTVKVDEFGNTLFEEAYRLSKVTMTKAFKKMQHRNHF